MQAKPLLAVSLQDYFQPNVGFFPQKANKWVRSQQGNWKFPLEDKFQRIKLEARLRKIQ